MSADTGSCYIWGLPNMCRPCKRALASGEPNDNPAQCYPASTVDDIKDLPLRALLDRQPVGTRRRLDRARSPAVNDPPAEPTTPKDGAAEAADEGWRLIRRVLDGSAWDDPDRSGM